jgi:predicted nuclease of predicted toxin-antitoxin system
LTIKLDENLSRHLSKPLEAEGHKVSTAAQEGMLGRSDSELAAAAARSGMMVFTLDLEFGDLRKYPPGSHAGVVLFRPRSMGPLSVAKYVLDFVRGADLEELE